MTTKPQTISKNTNETLFDAARRAFNQATINCKIVEYKDGNHSILVYPNDVVNNVIKAIKKIDLMKKIEDLEGLTA